MSKGTTQIEKRGKNDEFPVYKIGYDLPWIGPILMKYIW